jgi:Uma2 family endonuclease
MATSPHMKLSEYLTMSFRPDREYVDGMLVERNVGKNEHSRLQSLLAGWFGSQEDHWQVASLTGCRVQVSPTRVRILDVLLTTLKPHPEVLIEAPILVVEILSPEDNYAETRARASDYFRMGVTAVWIVDPRVCSGHWSTGGVWTQSDCLEVPGTQIYACLTPVFERLDVTRRPLRLNKSKSSPT